MAAARARLGEPALLLLWAAATLALAALGFDLINGFPYGLTYDDAYFYAQIAYNLGEHGRSSFDRIHTTSGYHLLWGGLLGLVSAAVALVSDDKLVHLFAFQAVFVGLALSMARAFHARLLERACALLFVLMGTLLMETLLLSTLLLVVARAEADASDERRAWPRVALASAFLVPLARIDAALILLVHAALRAADGEWRRALQLAGSLALGVLCQLGLMLALFGEPFSVSSMLKAGSADPLGGGLRASFLGPEGFALGYVMRSLLFLGLSAAVLGLAVAERGSRVNRRLFSLCLGAVLFSGGHMAAQLVPFWCYLPAYLILFYSLSRLELQARPWLLARRALYAGIAILGVAFVGHKLQQFRSGREVVRGARDFVERVELHVPRGGRIYQIDGSGFTGYFARRAVVNGDGLVNSYEYARRMRAGRLAGYLDEQGICYLITNRALQGGTLVDFGGLRVRAAESVEIARSRTFGLFPTTDFVLHRRLVPACPP